jgi:transcriptional regulator with XRE-family HTH domain
MNDFAKLLDKYTVGMTDEALAEKIGTSKVTIYNWRTGKVEQPSRQKVLKCAEVLKLTPKQRADFLEAAGHSPTNDEPQQLAIPVVGPPIIQPYQFFGRENILSQIHWAWNKQVPESIAIIGPNRSGKTSVLNYLNNINHATHLRPEQPKGWPNNWLPRRFQFALVDFHDANMHKPETLVTDVLRQLQLKIPQSCNLADFSSIIKQKVSHPTVILMDDIEGGLSASTLDTTFWQNMRSLANHGSLSFIVTASESPVQLAHDSGKMLPFFKIFGHTLQLEAFTENEARELLANSPKKFSAEDIDEMLKESGCWPEPLQKLCDTRLQQLWFGQVQRRAGKKKRTVGSKKKPQS